MEWEELARHLVYNVMNHLRLIMSACRRTNSPIDIYSFTKSDRPRKTATIKLAVGDEMWIFYGFGKEWFQARHIDAYKEHPEWFTWRASVDLLGDLSDDE